jgi:Ca2+-dependent lipid-binding protein
MHIQIFDRDPHPHNLMGEGTIDLSKVIREKEHDGYFLMKHNGQQAGEIYLELTFYPVVMTRCLLFFIYTHFLV